MPNTRVLYVRLDDEHHGWLIEQAQNNGQTLTAYVSNLVSALKESGMRLEVNQHARLVKDGVSDA